MKRRRILLSLAIAFALILLTALGWLFVRKVRRGTLRVEAIVSDRSGNRRSASPATLYLLDRDMMKLALVKAGEESALQQRVFAEHTGLRNLAAVLNARRREAYSLGPDVTLFVEQTEPLWQPHVIQTIQMDASGHATLGGIEPGEYWLMCRAETEDKGVAFWNLPLTVNRGENKIRLEPFNSLQCSSCR